MLKFYKNRITRAFTLVESLVALSLISGLASVGYVGFIEIKASSKAVKLEQDIAVVNSALNIYQAHGGTIDSSESLQNIIDKLKTVASDESIKEIIGLRESMIDQRLRVIIQSDKDAKSREPRALWDVDNNKFKISRSGKKGIKAFIIDQNLSVYNQVKENRNSNLKLAKKSKWVWDYQDHSSDLGNNSLPVNLVISDSLTDRESDGYQGALKLNMPSLSRIGGKYPLLDFEQFSLSISNPNPEKSSKIFYTTNGNQWLPYSGESITVNPGDTIAAMSASLEPSSWLDSGTSVNTYKASPVELQLLLSARDNPVDYRMMGGRMVEDSSVVRFGSEIFVSLHNNGQIPKRFIDPEKFNILWSLDDSRDLNFGEGNVVDNFTRGNAQTSISHSISTWESKSDLSLNVVAKSLEPSIFGDSKVSSISIGINKLPLDAPFSDVLESGDMGEGEGIVLFPSNKSGTLPENWRIYYTVNGIDPGTDQFGEPLNGALYISPISLESSNVEDLRIIARVYGPEGYSNWFNPSIAKIFSFNPWNVPEWNGYVGGIFHKKTVASYHNIRQHKLRGDVDSTFKPEKGLNGIGRAIALQEDGKVIVGGEFTTANGMKSNRIVRYDLSGKVDETFSIGEGFDDDVLALAIQPDGKIVVGGKFQKFDGEYRMGLARLNNDGSVDQDFNVGRGVHTDQNGWVHGLAIQKKGWSNNASEPNDPFKIIVAGCFTRYDNFPAFSLARIDLNGRLDMSFDTSIGVQGIVHGVCIQDDGGIIIGGNFEKYDGIKRKNIARVIADSGRIDRSFDPGLGTSSPVYTVNSYRDGKIFIGGSFNKFNEIDVSGVTRLLADGSHDESFYFNNEAGYKKWTAHSSYISAGGNVYVGGEIIINDESGECRPFIKLGANGTVTSDYIPEKLRNGSVVYAITERSNGRAIITGKFPEFYTKKTENIARLNTKTGRIDQSFHIGVGADGKVNVVQNLSDGNSIVAGNFTSINNVNRNYIAKVSPNGEVLKFNPKVGGGD
ncbi:prepilin-type N-terminal cleavage/methylation domain-containing protein [Verrucomicrobiales bacterium]|nr:prepilin-type N-terminal cleavage/methylation domain-containing protein [Verrucomicrobiales bacterium]